MNPSRSGRTPLLVAAVLIAVNAAVFWLPYTPLYAWVSSLHLYSDRIARLFPLALVAAAVNVQLAAILTISIRTRRSP